MCVYVRVSVCVYVFEKAQWDAHREMGTHLRERLIKRQKQ